MNIITIFYWIATILYFFNSFIYLKLFLEGKKIYKKLSIFFLPSTLALHAALLFFSNYFKGNILFSGIFELLSVIALAIMLIYYLLERLIKEVRATGFLIIPIAFLLQLLSSFFIKEEPASLNVELGNFFIWHIGLAVIAYATFITAFIYASLYLILFKELKQRHFGIIFKKMPSLEHLDDMNLKSCLIGFILLFSAILLGYIGKLKIYGQMFHLDPKVIISILLCLLYGVQLFGYFVLHWGGRRRSYISIMGLPIILCTMILGNYLTGFHHFF